MENGVEFRKMCGHYSSTILVRSGRVGSQITCCLTGSQRPHRCCPSRIKLKQSTVASLDAPKCDPPNCPCFLVDPNPHQASVALSVHPSPQSEWHLDRFSRFCRDPGRDQQTDTQTHHVCSNSAHLMLCFALLSRPDATKQFCCVGSGGVN